MGNPRVGNPDYKRDRNMSAPENEVIAARIKQLLTPLIYKQLSYYEQLGLLHRIQGLPLIVIPVLTLLWRQVPSVRELHYQVNREYLLLCKAVEVSEQALSKLFIEFPLLMFERVMMGLIPQLQAKQKEF